MEDTFFKDLNAAQREAVATTEGPLLVLAGAGTGKTRVITYRIANLLRRGVRPESILAVTFTNKASREMKERVHKLTGGKEKGMTISTFHSLGVRILRVEHAAIGYRPGFSITDSSDQLSLARTILRDIRGGAAPVEPKAVLAAISRAKNKFILPEDVLESASDDLEHLLAECYQRYQSGLRDRNCVDFDDLILLPVICLQKHEEIALKYKRQFRYVLVDEYQDTNSAQYQFLRCLVSPERNLCVVGDDDQSIYGFRGAEMDKILGFERDFPGARVVKLEENYRSTAAILNLANAVIANNLSRRKKTLRSTLGEGAKVRWVTLSDEAAEVDFVIQGIVRLTEAEQAPLENLVILIRAAIQARAFEEKLRLRHIPYTLVGGQSYFDRKEIRDVLAYWKVASNPADDLSLLRILNVPRRGFGTVTIQKIDAVARAKKFSFLEAMAAVADREGEFSESVRTACAHLRDLFSRARERLERREFSVMARELILEANYKEAVTDLYTDPLVRQARWASVEQVFLWVERWHNLNPSGEFSDYLEALALDQEESRQDKGEKRRGLTVMTLHSAKGLEFPHVFLVGVEEDLLPHRRSAAEGDSGIEEERRLFYVGITRARQSLTITQAGTRFLYGEPRPRQPSRFLEEVFATGLLEREIPSPGAPANEDDVREFLGEYRRLRQK